MKRITLLLSMLILMLISQSPLLSQPNKGNFTMEYTDRGIKSYIYFWVPEDYDSTKSYPFLLAWHGAGDTGENNRNFFTYLLAQRVGAILVCPDANNINGQDGSYFMNLTNASYSYTVTTYNIDTNKIIVMGFSWGGGFAYQLVLTNPNLFKGIIGLAPAIGQLDQTMWNNITKVRMSTILGDKDFNYSVVNKLMNDIKNAGGALLYLIKPGVQHVDNNYFNSQEIIVDLRQCYDFVTMVVKAPLIITNRSDVDFDTTQIGLQKILPLEITNLGSADLIIDEITITNEQESVFSIDGNLTNITVTPGSKISYNIVFNPISETDYTGQIKIQSNDSTHKTLILNLSGSGYSVKPLIETSDTIIRFGIVKLNESKNQSFRIYNTGTQVLTITGLTLENIPEDVISLPSFEYPLDVAPAGYQSFSIRFTPKDTIDYQGRIKISSNADNLSELFINIMGKGDKPSEVDELLTENFSLKIYPNPFENNLTLEVNYTGAISENLHLLLVDINGNIISDIYNNKISIDKYNFNFNNNLTNGLYFIKAEFGSKTVIRPLFRIR